MPYRASSDWEKVVKEKWLIFDADALISIIAFGAEDLLDKLLKLDAKFAYIHPVLLELMNTDNAKEKLKRTSILGRCNFTQLPITAAETKHATTIQESLPINIKSKPSSTDFYLGGVLAKYTQSNAFLLTSNTKDFPLPIFPREAFIPLFNDTDVKFISIISLDHTQLVPAS